MTKTALITGITGQDGSYLAELLLRKSYSVHGIIRRSSSFNTDRIAHLLSHPSFKLHYGDLTDSSNLCTIIGSVRPDEVYNLGAQSHVKVSFEVPEYTAEVDAVGTLRLLSAIIACGLQHSCRFYQASTSELYGKVLEVPQTETTPFNPQSPYAVAKQFAYSIVKNYREAFGMYAVNGILFNHESPRRGQTFVTRKITHGISKIKHGIEKDIVLGNLNALRDWGHAKDYVEGMWRMLQQEKPDDFVLATGEMHSVREFVELSFAHVGITIAWTGEGVEEVGYNAGAPDQVLVRVCPKYFRPAEVDQLLGDASKAKAKLGWEPVTKFKDLVTEMMTEDLKI